MALVWIVVNVIGYIYDTDECYMDNTDECRVEACGHELDRETDHVKKLLSDEGIKSNNNHDIWNLTIILIGF